jgi:glycosyltransferase involved in cell wall biosynthesis
MRVAVDARPAVAPHRTGIGQYTWELLRHLPGVDPATSYVAWYLNARGTVGGSRRFLRDLAAPNLVERWTPIPARLFERLTARLDLPRVEWFVRFDVLFAPNFIPPPTRARALVVTVHDLAFRRFPETAPQGTRWWLERLDRTLARAARVIAVSDCTRRDLIELSHVEPGRVVAIPHGVDRDAFQPASEPEVEAVRTRFGIDGPYLLSLGGIEPRKNLPSLIRAYAALPADVRPTLIIAGAGVAWNPEGGRLLDAALAELPGQVRERISLVGYVSGADKAALIGGAEALVYPSLYEGFGLPVLEAMACGTPVLTSDVSALPEVAGGAAVLVDPRSVDSIREGIQRLLTDDQLRAGLTEAGMARAEAFSWTETARRTASVLREVGSSG